MALEESKIKFAKEYPVAQIIEKRLGVGKKRGSEILYECRFHKDKHNSLSVNPSKNIAKCFACGWQNDAIGFLIDMGSTFVEAVEELNEGLGGSSGTPVVRESLSKKIDWVQLNNPDKLPKRFNHYLYGDPTMEPWAYRNADGSVRGYVVRYLDEEKGKKVTIPLIFAKNGNKTDWRFQGFSSPRPLYNLDKIVSSPDKTILLVEGEKTADAGTRLLDSFDKIIATTWAGGSSARLSDIDFSPLFGKRIILWPDNDIGQHYGDKHPKAGQLMPWHEQCGNAVMLAIAEILKPHCQVIKWVNAPNGSPDKWDIADWNVTAQEARSYILSNMISIEDIKIPVEPPSIVIPPNSGELEPAPTPIAEAKASKPRSSEQQPGGKHFRFLGYSSEAGDHSYFFFRESTCKIIQMTPSSMTTPNLIQLAPLRWWEEKFPGTKGLSTNGVIEFLIRTSEGKGGFDTENIRGRGAWTEGNDSVIHCGNYLIVNGKQRELGVVGGKYLYEAGRAFEIGGPVSATTQEAFEVLNLIKRLNWERPVNAYLLAGWCVVAPMCGALPWRPHIWLTGASGSGKSWIIEKIIEILLGGSVKKVQGSGTSEAGIRQALGRDARPVIFEEAEGEGINAQAKIQEILGLVRLSSSNGGGDLLKGSANGKSVNYTMRSCFAFASIAVQLKQRSDISRVSVIGLLADKEAGWRDRWKATLEQYNNIMTDDLPSKIQARTISLLPIILKNAKTFSNAAAAELGTQRAGDQIGVLLAGAYSLSSGKEISFDDAISWIKGMDWSEEKGTEGSRDEIMLIGHILKQITSIEVADKGKVERTIAELLMAAEGSLNDPIVLSDAANNRLKRLGIKYLLDDSDPGNHIKMILISNRNSWIDKCLSGTPWANGYSKILQRIEGARISEATRFAGTKDRAVILPFSIIL